MNRNEALRAFQDRLNRIGLYPEKGDGLWGPMTEAAFDQAISTLEKRAGIEPPRYPNLPLSYGWLSDLSPLPLTVQAALVLLGTKEIPGRANSPKIMSWAAEVGLTPASYPSDEVAWCGLAVAVILKRAGKPIDMVGNILGARQWLKFGERAETPSLGDVLVFWRGSPNDWRGHVGIYIAEDDDAYHVAGGNQSNAFNIMRLHKSRLLEARRPIYRSKPSTVRPYLVEARGGLSRNEA